MRQLLSVQNVDPVTADYPKGKTRDRDGSTPGTISGEPLFGDIIQFFQKLIIDGGIVENDTPENVSNGYQLIEALSEKIKSISTVQTSIINCDGAGAELYQGGDFILTCTRLAIGSFRITHNLNTTNYAISVIGANGGDLNKITSSSVSELSSNTVDCYFHGVDVSSGFTDPISFSVMISKIR